MECYEGATMIKTFRGLLGTAVNFNADSLKIMLATNNGSTGYRIVALKLMPYDFGASTSEVEAIVKVYKVDPGTPTPTIDFSDNTLLAAAVMTADSNANTNGVSFATVFDNEIFNQDITITYYNNKTGELAAFMNFYIELEQIKLDLNENTVATLKDIRNKELRTMIA